jgi:hypothetical protein
VKPLALAIFLIGICFNVNAQQNRFIGGVLFDLNGIGLLGNTGQYWNSSTENDGVGHGGISCGVFVKREFSEKVYSTFELRYSTKGSYYGYVGPNGTQGSESLYLNYFEFPLLIGLKLRSPKKTYYFETGFEFSKLYNSRIEANEEFPREGTPNTNDFKSNDLSWIGSFKFPLIRKWQENFLVGIRLTHSIVPIHKEVRIYNFEYGIEFNYLFD